MLSGFDPEVLRSFQEEARSYLPALRSGMEMLRAAPDDADTLRELHRLAHSIRGAGEMVGLEDLSATARALEDMLGLAAESGAPCDGNLIALLEDGLTTMAACLRDPDATVPAPAEEAVAEIRPEEIPGDLLDSFLEEAEERLQSIGERLRESGARKDRQPLLREVRRSVHTIKGAAGMVGLNDISRLAHRMEDVLDLLYEGQAPYTPECHQLLTATYDVLCDMVSARGRTASFQPRVRQLYTLYDALLAAPANPPAPVPPPPPESAPEPVLEQIPDETAAADPTLFVRVPLKRMDELVRLVGELFVNSSVFEQQLDAYRHEVDELSLSLARMRRIASSMETRHATFNPGAAGTPLHYEDLRHGEFDALEFDRYTQLHLLSRDLNEATNDLAAVGNELDVVTGGFGGILTRQVRLSSEIQDKLMRLRMVPLTTVANRLHRTVRVSAHKRGKLAELVLEGVTTELDKTVMEQLAGPLEHLLRNAVDHGIEDPAARRAAGKSERGLIRLSATYEGTQVVLRVSDDGSGLDLEKIRAQAVQLGYYSEAEAKGLNQEQLSHLLFEPGFSTAASVSEISGRGVGLDVVKAGAESLEGTLSLDSRPGQGATFTIRLPMTLAITKVLMVEAQQERYAIPLAAVTRAARIEPGMIETAGPRHLIRLEDRILPVMHLAGLLGMRAPAELPSAGRLPLVVVRTGESEIALLVDRIVEAREVAVKPLAGLLRNVPRMTGATILGDGGVVLILNPAELAPSRQQPSQPAPRRRTPSQRSTVEILIVDDSPSVRRAVANLVRNTGWIPVQAKDGVEALELLQRNDRRPDAILMDIEMPRMDGFELTSALRAQAAYRHTPVIMLTSRAGEKHRRKALDAGANEYLVKPYQDDALLEVVRRCVEESRKASQVA